MGGNWSFFCFHELNEYAYFPKIIAVNVLERKNTFFLENIHAHLVRENRRKINIPQASAPTKTTFCENLTGKIGI